MADGKHTAGEWRFLEEGCSEEEFNAGRALTISGGPNNDDIANVFSRDDFTVLISREEACANARLIAAAPELLEALEYIAQLNDAKIEDADSETIFTLLRMKVDRARAAIARATGAGQ